MKIKSTEKYAALLLKRGIISSTLFCLLLILAGTLLCLGTGLLVTALNSGMDMDSKFTTIALPDTASIRRYSDNYAKNNNLTEFIAPNGRIYYNTDYFFDFDVSSWISHEINDNIANRIYGSGMFEMDTRRVFGAWSPGITPFTSESERNIGLRGSYANSTSAFTAVVIDIEPYFRDTRERENNSTYFIENMYVILQVTETLLLHPGHLRPEILRIPFSTFNADGTPLFEIGKRYFILGRSYDYLERSILNGVDSYKNAWLTIHNGFSGNRILSGNVESVSDVPDYEWSIMWTEIREDEWPIPIYRYINDFFDPVSMIMGFDSGYRAVIELPDDSSSPLPRELHDEIDEILEMGRKSVDNLTVLTTGALDSMYLFNQKKAAVTEGRTFTPEETNNGARVCIVHEQIAGINVGDMIPINLYQSSLEIIYIGSDIMTSILVWSTEPYSPVKLHSEPIMFEVIGTFSAPLLDRSDHALMLNTVIIPDTSVAAFPYIFTPDMEQNIRQILDETGDSVELISWASKRLDASDDPETRVTFEDWYSMFANPPNGDIPLLNTIIIPNGRNEEFAEAINAMLPEYSGFFRIYDQGYSFVKNALEILLRGGILIFALCLAGWVISVIIFCLFFVQKKKKETELLFAIGINRKHRFRWVFIQSVMIILISITVTFAISFGMYGLTLDYAYTAAGNQAGEQDTMFSDAVIVDDNEDIEFALIRDPLTIPIVATSQLLLLLIFAGLLSASISKNNTSKPKSLKGADM